MFILSAFADEISPDPQVQVDVLKSCGVHHIELRSVHKTNVLDLTDLQIQELKALFDRNGIKLSAIGSPIGKIKITDPFEPHLKRLQRAIDLCKVFNTRNIRIFSYYPPEGVTDWTPHRAEVMRRMIEKARLAQKAGVRLVHENEHRIYGDEPERVRDVLDTVLKEVTLEHFGNVYDPANYVFCGYDPWKGWLLTKDKTVHFHIKDWIHGEPHGVVAGAGQGRIPEVMAEAVRMGYDGFAVLEPHLIGGGPTGGVTGPELFPKAVAAYKLVLDQAGAKYQ